MTKPRFLFSGWFLIALLLNGCSQGEPEGIRLGLSAAPVTLDPRYATDAASYRITRLIYRSLVDFDSAFRPIPALAEWEAISPVQYRFRLGAQGREFHDGTRLTSRDVKATYESVLQAKNASPHRGSLAMIRRIETLGDKTVDFFLDKPDPLFPGRLVIGILPQHLIAEGHAFNKAPVGSGPMRFIEWARSGRLYLQRRIDGASIQFITVPDPTVRVLKLLRNEIDLFQGDVPHEMVGWLQKRAEVQVTKGRGSTFTYLGFNMADPVVGRREFRQAVAYALDRDAIIKYVMGGAAHKASAMLPPGHWAGSPDLRAYEYDPKKAGRLLHQGDHSESQSLRVTYKTSNNPFRVRLATVVQYQLRQVGIDLDVRSYDWGTFYGDIKAGRFQMYSLSWVGLKMPDIFRYAFHSSSLPPEGANRGRFIDRRADQLIERAEAAADLERQAALYRELQAYLLEELPYVPLWYEDNVLIRRQDITGYTLATDGDYDGLITTKRIQ
jgi:peptide/nickel transport system substrate-binding protein